MSLSGTAVPATVNRRVKGGPYGNTGMTLILRTFEGELLQPISSLADITMAGADAQGSFMLFADYPTDADGNRLTGSLPILPADQIVATHPEIDPVKGLSVKYARAFSPDHLEIIVTVPI